MADRERLLGADHPVMLADRAALSVRPAEGR
ncbi:hypothetical protein ACIP4Y_21920 [Streptomyces sp. NPDC088810]